ncbi:MAG: DUF3566 domain-containing protein [Nostocoides sp.]
MSATQKSANPVTADDARDSSMVTELDAQTAAVPTERSEDLTSAASSTPPAPAFPPTVSAAPTDPAPAKPAPARSRRVRLTVARIDPWSAMKMSFLLSVALGIALVVMTFVLWTILDAMGVFSSVDEMLGQVLAGGSGSSSVSISDFVGLGRVLSLSVVIGVIDVVLLTAIATLGAFLYNVCATLVGGLQLTLTDD